MHFHRIKSMLSITKAGTSMGQKMIEGLLEYVTNETETGEIIRSIDETRALLL
jgi:hypothetical protein